MVFSFFKVKFSEWQHFYVLWWWVFFPTSWYFAFPSSCLLVFISLCIRCFPSVILRRILHFLGCFCGLTMIYLGIRSSPVLHLACWCSLSLWIHSLMSDVNLGKVSHIIISNISYVLFTFCFLTGMLKMLPFSSCLPVLWYSVLFSVFFFPV